jgi:AraC-like DNA-binding protein
LTPPFAPTNIKRQRWAHGLDLPRHRHESGYLCLVLSGGFEEAGDCGRRIVRAGDVNCHGPFDAHCNRFLSNGAETLNFDLPKWAHPKTPFCRVSDPDLIARAAEWDTIAARELLLSMLECVRCTARDWPDELAIDIHRHPRLCLSEWAERRGLAPASLSRGFRRIYEVSPNAFRAQIRVRRAWSSLLNSDLPLSVVALDNGFADQAHMTRAVTILTGRCPSEWRRLGLSRFKTQDRIGRKIQR